MNRNVLQTNCKSLFIRIPVVAVLLVGGAFMAFWNLEIYSYKRSNHFKRHDSSQKLGLKNNSYSQKDLFPKNIFLIETSGSHKLTPRQACAVESAAIHHPHSETQVLMFSSEPLEDTFGLSRFFSNIHIKSTKFEDIFIDTPLWNWFEKSDWNTSKYRVNELSDAIRVLLVWKYGGLYLDLDTVTLRPLYRKRNYLFKQFTEGICNCCFSFESQHPFLSKYLEKFSTSYKKGIWGSVGPTLFTELFKSLCQISLVEGTFTRCNVTLFPTETAFPVHWSKWRDYFSKIKTEELLIKIKDSYLIHVWNFLSKEQSLSLNSGTLYEEAMKENCPVVYDYVVADSSLNASFSF